MPHRLPHLLLLWLLMPCAVLRAQLPLHNPVPASYDVPMQRLLVLSMGSYVHAISQGTMDNDSAMLFATEAFRLSRLLPYNDGFSSGAGYPGQALIVAGKISTATQLLPGMQGVPRMQLLAELGLYYLHRAGAVQADMDSARAYTRQLMLAATAAKDLHWQVRGLWMQGVVDNAAASPAFRDATALARKSGDIHLLTMALLAEGNALPPGAPGREATLKAAQALALQTGSLQDQYLVILGLANEHIFTRPEKMLEDTQLAITLEKKMHFLHQQYSFNALAYWYIVAGDMIKARQAAEQTIVAMEQSKDTVLSTVFCMRMAEAFINTEDSAQASIWINRSLNVPLTRSTQMLWFKSVLTKLRLLSETGHFPEMLSFAKDIEIHHSPVTDFEKMHFQYRFAQAYQGMGQGAAALDHYQQFLQIAEKFPRQYAYMEMMDAYNQIAAVFYDRGQYSAARQYAERVLSNTLAPSGLPQLGPANHMLFKIDSIEGNYQKAIQHYQRFQYFKDSIYSLEQRKKIEELKVQYETRQKDQDITLLKQNSQLQQAQLSRSSLLGTLALSGAVLLLIIVALLFNQYRIKQRSNRQTLVKNEALRQLVDEKEWLLREVHHRVKNNLQTIVSLLESQSNYLQDDALLAIQDSQNRIYAMSLIHQKLYRNQHMATVNMGVYLEELAHHLMDSYDVKNSIAFKLDLHETELDVSQAIPLGLIVNEAVTNAIKYAFPGKQEGKRIALVFRVNGQEGLLSVADNGIGMDPGILSKKAAGLGLKLMQGLSADIDATFSLDCSAGTVITIRFTVNRPLK